MTNIEIEVMGADYIIVRADTPRFGRGEIMYEGNTFDECFEYVKRETGRETLSLSGCIADGIFTDRVGRAFPTFMKCI